MGGHYRIIDFTLSNCVNSGLRRVFCLTQYKALELARHLREGWNLFSREMGEFIEPLPPMKRIHSDWYLGTADAVYQNIESILLEKPSQVLILSGDHIYKMDYREMLTRHLRHGADATIATIQIPPSEARHFGIVDIDPASHNVVGFEEKPQHGDPARSPFNPEMASASMGIYLFETGILLDALRADASDGCSNHDFGQNVLPRLLRIANVLAYDFHDLNDKTARYWRDVGTIDAYYEANMDLVSVTPEFNLYDARWPIRTRMPQAPPAKFVFAQEGRRMGVATDSIVSPGAIVSGGRVNRSVLSPGVRVNSYSELDSCIVLHNAQIGRYCRLRRAIIDHDVILPEGTVLGEDPAADRAAGHHVTPAGVTVASNNH
jgi:glucose-1-phosphate adenylyltransferase